MTLPQLYYYCEGDQPQAMSPNLARIRAQSAAIAEERRKRHIREDMKALRRQGRSRG